MRTCFRKFIVSPATKSLDIHQSHLFLLCLIALLCCALLCFRVPYPFPTNPYYLFSGACRRRMRIRRRPTRTTAGMVIKSCPNGCRQLSPGPVVSFVRCGKLTGICWARDRRARQRATWTVTWRGACDTHKAGKLTDIPTANRRNKRTLKWTWSERECGRDWTCSSSSCIVCCSTQAHHHHHHRHRHEQQHRQHGPPGTAVGVEE